MSRKSSFLDDLLFIATKLPWWLSVAIGVGAYGYLHSLSLAPIPIYSDLNHLQSVVFSTLLKPVATFGQYLLPLVFLSGAAASVLGRRKRRNLLAAMTMAGGETAATISWQQFELLVGEALRHQGFSVLETGGNGPDGGVDLIARKDGETYLVQCKQWRSLQVGIPVVRELYGAMAAEGATGGMVITSGRFTGPAKQFASGRNLRLVDGELLNKWIAASKRAGPKPTSEVVETRKEPAVEAPAVATAVAVVEELIKPAAPACPHCKKQMVIRVARSGANAGGDFWGCSAYPKCRGIRTIFKVL
ncbi:restriction endonuclease [Pseudomonas sp. MH10]|uniref:restriction endonuclease n=1 Tax=Pseudomonas sp. MH10 TaxID=3048627 RepID=UPI002AC99879|nr:restriction endonuclease [Pseudomonas sp. MH10]MEB0041302.1 restriction endonuclease [Pseudomonas sp. MH10]WPX63802.1 restriction endonuclease [Pseudomonas sp. MH10]